MNIETPPLTGEERLFLSSRVNRLCEIEVQDFDPDTQLEEVHHVVDLLDPRLKPWKFQLSGEHHGDPGSHSVTGSTNQGDFSTSFESDGVKRFSVGGGDEFRTGMYVVIKYPGRESNFLIFEHFWDRGENNAVFGTRPSQTVIGYETGNLRLKTIERIIYRSNTWGPFALVIGDHLEMWPEKGKEYSKTAGLNIRF